MSGLRQSNDDERILAEAGEWVARRRGVRVEDARADSVFEDWLMADPRHGDAYDALSERWEDVGALEQLRPLVDPNVERRSWGAHLARRPRTLAAGLAMAAALVLGVFLAPGMLEQPQARYETEIAEIRPVTLPDGSAVTLGADSHLDLFFTETERRVRLRGGEAFFDVAHDEERPFFVLAGDAIVRVVGTKFDVRRGAGNVSVAVLEGVVRVSNAGRGTPENQRTLRAGERIEVPETVFLAPARPLTEIASVGPSPPGAWRDGWLAYDNTPLTEVVADLNRYYAPGVRIAGDAGELRITGTFRSADVPQVMDALPRVVDVDVSRADDASYRIAEAAN